jgi:hypothetical protein
MVEQFLVCHIHNQKAHDLTFVKLFPLPWIAVVKNRVPRRVKSAPPPLCPHFVIEHWPLRSEDGHFESFHMTIVS